MIAKMGDWVEIENIVLEPGSRAPQVPPDTQKVPLKIWRKGYLLDKSANIGDTVEIKTLIGRKARGMLSDINPSHKYDYGSPVKELIDVGVELRTSLELIERG